MEKLKTGDQAPDFSFTDASGATKKLSDYLGKKVILYFYPKDNTPGCTLEACSLRDGYDELRDQGYEVIGVSADSAKSHEGFKAKFNLPFALVSDTDKSVLNSYGVWGEKMFMGKKFMGIIRTTFVIDEKGNISRVIEKVNTKDHAKQILGEIEK
jgi:thioredoxin-dependent peroxiredoxin